MGLGGTWAIQNLDPYDPHNLGISYDDAWGINYRLGARVAGGAATRLVGSLTYPNW